MKGRKVCWVWDEGATHTCREPPHREVQRPPITPQMSPGIRALITNPRTAWSPTGPPDIEYLLSLLMSSISKQGYEGTRVQVEPTF